MHEKKIKTLISSCIKSMSRLIFVLDKAITAQCAEVGGSNLWSGQVKDWKIGTCCFPGMVSIHHLRPRTGLVVPVSV